MRDEYILAIETSCDETAVAIVKNGTEIVSNIVASQIESHKRFGGVVPEIASRHHVESMTLVLEEAMQKAGITYDQLDAIAVTEGPGLVGALLIGVNAAKAVAFGHGIPLVGVHHIYMRTASSRKCPSRLSLWLSQEAIRNLCICKNTVLLKSWARQGMTLQEKHMTRWRGH